MYKLTVKSKLSIYVFRGTEHAILEKLAECMRCLPDCVCTIEKG